MTESRTSRRAPRRWPLALAALLASLALAEIALHVLDLPSRRSDFQFVRPDLEVGEVFADLGAALVPDPELFWTLDPTLGTRLANRHGLRGWWPSRSKEPSDVRIVCVGDSCTFGTSVRYEDTYGVRLETKLQEEMPDRCVETMLLAVPGYSTHQDRLLCERHLEELEPDVTVLYCGAWNDYLPAVSLSDADRYAENTSRAPRLLRLLGRVLGPSTVPADELRQAFREGKAPRGRRVPLDAFRANLERMIELAEASRSRVVMVVPPLPPSTEQSYPVSLEYRDVVADVAGKHALDLVDAPWMFALEGGDGPPLFHDWVHPTARGHELIAASLRAVVEEELTDAPPARDVPVPAIEDIAPRRMTALTTQRFEIAGRGFSAANAFDRVWLGPRWIERFEVRDDGRLTFTLMRPLPPGEHAVTLRTRRGVVSGAQTILVEHGPLVLAAELRANEEPRELRLSGHGTADCIVGVWLASGLLERAFDSGYGPFWLETDLAGQVPGALRLDQLGLFAANGQTQHEGTWQIAVPLARAGVAEGSEAVFAQAILADRFEPNLAWFTVPVRVELP